MSSACISARRSSALPASLQTTLVSRRDRACEPGRVLTEAPGMAGVGSLTALGLNSLTFLRCTPLSHCALQPLTHGYLWVTEMAPEPSWCPLWSEHVLQSLGDPLPASRAVVARPRRQSKYP